jgi:uncharacterized protein involved in copper resistance
MHKKIARFFVSARLVALLLTISLTMLLTATVASAAEMDHSNMDQGAMDHNTMDQGAMDQGAMDHSKMDHGEMNHGEMNHSTMSHATMVHDAPPALATLSVMPASGKAREGGADGRYVMESTSVLDSMAEQCAKASRGLIMLDNAGWSQCGGKPQGAASTSPGMAAGHEHAGHAMP